VSGQDRGQLPQLKCLSALTTKRVTQAVKELMERRSGSSADRPNLHVANEIITNGHHLLAMPYGDRWRVRPNREKKIILKTRHESSDIYLLGGQNPQLVRKILHQHLTIRMCEENHQHIQEAESAQVVSCPTTVVSGILTMFLD
jgi:hypothetical protein